MHIIMIAGKAGVGKTTLAKIIAAEVFDRGLIPVMQSFAKPIKDEAYEKGYTKEEYPEKYREYCQKMGAQMREMDPDYWVKLMAVEFEKEIDTEKRALDEGKKFWERCVIIDDCRYTNELNIGSEYGGVALFLSSGERSLENHSWREHESESLANDIEVNKSDYLNSFDCMLLNDGDVDDLHQKVCDLLPMWCNLKALKKDECQCVKCKTHRDNTSAELGEILENLLDLLDLNDWQEEDENGEA